MLFNMYIIFISSLAVRCARQQNVPHSLKCITISIYYKALKYAIFENNPYNYCLLNSLQPSLWHLIYQIQIKEITELSVTFQTVMKHSMSQFKGGLSLVKTTLAKVTIESKFEKYTTQQKCMIFNYLHSYYMHK